MKWTGAEELAQSSQFGGDGMSWENYGGGPVS